MNVGATRDFSALYEKAKEMAKEFTNLNGIELKFNHFYIDSPYYGYIDKIENFPEDDPDSVFVFQFDETDNNYETVSFVPTLNKAMVWRSLSDDNPYWNACYYDDEAVDYGEEGAVNPNSGIAQWEDWLADSLHPLNDWKNYKRPKMAM